MTPGYLSSQLDSELRGREGQLGGQSWWARGRRCYALGLFSLRCCRCWLRSSPAVGLESHARATGAVGESR